MALKINDECTACGVCEPECPNQAITAGDPAFIIDAEKCDECAANDGNPKCIEVCPVDCIVKA